MNRFLLILVILLSASSFTNPVLACQCREYGTPLCAQFWRSDAVFIGKVIDIKPLKRKPDDVYTYVVASFRVRESFRGVTGPNVGVAVATNTLCEPKFEKGKSYLVYASLYNDQLFTGMCRGTSLVSDVDYVTELRKLSQRETEQSISGRIKTNRYQGLAGIKIEVISKDQTFKTMTTDSYGDFSISLPHPGSFTVRITVPYAARLVDNSVDDVTVRSSQTESLSTFEYDVTLEKSQCSYLELAVSWQPPRTREILISPRAF